MIPYPTTPPCPADPLRRAAAAALAALLLLAVGCGQPVEPEPTYTRVPPPDQAQAATPPAPAMPTALPADHPPIPGRPTPPADAAPVAPPAPAPAAGGMQMTPDLPRDATPRDAVSWTLPAGWHEAPASGMRLATLHLPEQAGEVSILILGGDGGKLVWNVNRWRAELGLPAIDAAGAEGLAAPLADSATPGTRWLRLDGEATGTLAALVPMQERTLFATIKAPTAVLAANQPAFLAFARSIQVANVAVP